MNISLILGCRKIQSFSAVVGPNGSGKSNVIDAMLFVFGKRAKQVRYSFFFFFFVWASACFR